MDHFKRINDTYGHLNGDLVLQELAHRLAGCLRKSDVFARLGGDEFAIILPETNYEHGLAVATKLHLAMNASPFSLPCGEIAISASISLVEYPDDGKDVVELQSAMDQVLYRAKAAGKNCVMSLRSTAPLVA
jgi:diguanylate cyclase (GGDEF)-like protein